MNAGKAMITNPIVKLFFTTFSKLTFCWTTSLFWVNLLSIFVKSDLFIRGAQFDSFGLSKVEAILMGAKVISTKAGITNFMEIYEYQNAESLLVVMQKALVIDNTKTDERKNYLQKLAIDNFNKIIDIYDSL